MKQPFNKDEFYANAIKELGEDSLYRDFDEVALKSKDIEVLETGKQIYDYILNGDMRKLPYDYYMRAKYEIKLKDLDAAGKDLKMAVLERTKENSYYDTELLEECIKFLSKQEGKEAAAKFLEEAEIELDKKIKIDPSNMGCKLIVADLYKKLGKKEKLLNIYLELCEALPFNNYESYVTDIYKSAKKYDEALDFISSLIEKYPDHKEFYYSRAAIYSEYLRDYENAIKDFNKYIELSENKSSLELNVLGFIAENYLKLNQSDKAIDYYNKAIENDPNYIYNYDQLGNLYFQLGKFEEAYAVFKKQLELPEASNNDLVRTNMAICLMKLKKLDESEKLFIEALNLNPDNYLTYYGYACNLSLQNRKDEALEKLEKALTINPYIKEEVKSDSEFDSIKDDYKFKELTQ